MGNKRDILVSKKMRRKSPMRHTHTKGNGLNDKIIDIAK